jgi:hypothetical protein
VPSDKSKAIKWTQLSAREAAAFDSPIKQQSTPAIWQAVGKHTKETVKWVAWRFSNARFERQFKR